MRAFRHLALTSLLALFGTNFVPSWSFTVAPTRVGWAGTRQSRFVRRRASSSDEEPDLFEYFDPLLSPHAYPNGISPDETPQEPAPVERKKEIYDPLRLSERFGFENENDDKPAEPATVEEDTEEVDILEVFDPTLSPHMYPDGIPSTKRTKKSPVRVGILLMDHGSKNKASNDRLHELAEKYQETVGPNVIVRAAHMEIASPSIPEGLETLLDKGVDEIVCHPYFLSPQSRHVAEDIPRIVDEAIESLNIDIPIATTDPVGAHMDVMISAIQTVVLETSDTLQKEAAK